MKSVINWLSKMLESMANAFMHPLKNDSPVISAKGLPIENLEEFKFGLEKEINKTARSFALNNTKQEENAINALKTVCRKFTKEQVGKRPFTNINLVNI